jgi:two-component system LytT family response regulator/two-component system response regulator LytT
MNSVPPMTRTSMGRNLLGPARPREGSCYDNNFMPDRATATLTAVLVDDEPLAREELTYLLKEFPEIEIVGTGCNGIEALSLIQSLEPDLAFLDIQMPGLDGLAVVRKLKDSGAELPHFIFATAYDEYAVEAFRIHAMDYLLKPIEKERLEETIERARRSLDERQKAGAAAEAAVEAPAQRPPAPQRTKLLVRSQNRNFIVDSQELIYATIDDGIITLATVNLEGQSNYRTIEELQASLDAGTFWRAHRSYLVNINRIKEVVPWFKSSYQLRMDDRKHTEIPVSRMQTRRLRELLKL